FRVEQLDPKRPLVRYDEIDTCVRALRTELDHQYLNEVVGLKERPMTTESLAEYIYERVESMMPLDRVRLRERTDFFAEAWKANTIFLGLQVPFYAAHRLHTATLSDAENMRLYGKCNNPSGHGHGYLTETTIGGEYDERSGTLYDFVALNDAVHESLKPWQDRHLDLETEDFRDAPSTGENIVRALWPRVDNRVNQQLVRLRLWETTNNRFTLRRMYLWRRSMSDETQVVGGRRPPLHMKRYLITGASRGIGRAIAEKVAGNDVELLLHGRNTVALAETRKLVETQCAK